MEHATPQNFGLATYARLLAFSSHVSFPMGARFLLALTMVMVAGPPSLAQTTSPRLLGRTNTEVEFTRIVDVAVRPGTRDAYVLDASEPYLRIIDERGAVVRAFARRGGGPGEMTRPQRLGWRGDTLWVVHDRNRVTSYAPDGTVIGSFLVHPDQLPGAMALDVVTDGGILVAAPDSAARLWMLAHVRGQTVRRLATQPFAENENLVRLPIHVGAAKGVTTVPLSPTLSLRPLAAFGGQTVVLVARDDPERFAVIGVNVGGDTTFRARFPYRRQAINKRTVEAWARGTLATVVRESNIPFEVDLDQAIAQIALPRWLPAVSDVKVGGDGSIWLRREDDLVRRTIQYLILSADGQPLGNVTFPRSEAVFEAGAGRIWTVATDADGVTTLTWYAY